MSVSDDYKQKVEQQQIIKEEIDRHNSDTGYVTFPDNNTLRVQFICNGHCPPSLLNRINSTIEHHFSVCEIKHWSGDSFLVELER